MRIQLFQMQRRAKKGMPTSLRQNGTEDTSKKYW